MRSCLALVCFSVFALISFDAKAQSYEDGTPYQMELITEQMADELIDIPASIRRVAVYKLNYNALRFSAEEVEYIRGEVESSFREFTGVTVLSPPELEPNNKMKIMGNDSTLQILNIQGRSLADVSPEFLTEITDKYSIQGLIELSFQRRSPEGIILSIRMINPNSREIVWSKSFISSPFVVDIDRDLGSTLVIGFGVGSRQTESIMFADTALATQDTLLSSPIVDFNATLTYRQPIKEDNSAYIGFTGGFSILRSREASSFNITLMELGATYYQAITDLNEEINDYRVVLFLNSNIQFPLNDTKGEFINARPGIMLNLSNNLGISFYTNLVLSGETFTQPNNDLYTYNKVSYGFNAVIRF